MGKPIVYCSACGAGLREGGSSRERIYRFGEMVYCGGCKPPEAVQSDSSVSERRVSSVRIPRVSETPRAFSTRFLPRSRGSSAPLVGIVAGALILLVIAVVALSGKRGPPPPLEKAQPATAKAPGPSTPSHAPELAKLDEELRRALDREDFRAALAALEGARSRRSEETWTLPVDERIRDVNTRAMTLFTSLKQDAAAAAKEGNKAKLDGIRARVERWGRRDFVLEFDRLTAAETPPPPPPPPPPVERPWTALFDGQTTGFLRGSAAPGWTVIDGALARKEDNAAQTKQDFQDGELRIRFTTDLTGTTFFCVRQGGEGLHRVDLRERARAGQTHELRMTMNGPSVTATLDGQPLDVQTQGKPAFGAVQFNGPAGFRLYALEFRPLP